MEIDQGWAQIISFFLANAALILWFRTESRNDWRHMDSKFDKIHDEIMKLNLDMAKEGRK